ncbi:MAG: NUDIX domain-containing protein [Dysgonamonadaceae bacterium]|jgi:ADP-ribose pyrophosphatase YjhB (NUDIX family)|nr:NUDIX domain-containing protein [Dysgonamonadaceae bacterium]
MNTQYYENNSKFLIAVDCIIFGFKNNELNILLTRRPVEPLKNEWSLMGGFMENGESLDDAAKKVLYRYTQQTGIYMEQVASYGEIDRDTGGRVISVAFYALVRLDEFDTSIAKKFDATWININKLPTLVFDHNKMVQDALKVLRYKVSLEPIIFEFFGEKFTLPALQNLYEAIYQTEIDKRNFRRKLISMNILNKYEEKDKSSSKRGAHYYSFDHGKYVQFLKKGYIYSL